MKLGKKLISFLLCAAMLLSVAPLQALPVFAGSGEAVQATDIAAGETLTAEIAAGETVYFRFVPEEDGVYSFTSEAEDDTYGYLYDADMNELAEDDDSGEGRQFLITWRCTAGVTYYFGVRFYNGEKFGSIPVRLYENDTWCGDGYNVVVTPETEVTLFAEAWSRIGEITYQWTNRETEEPEEETGPYLAVGPVTKNMYYFCRVTLPPADEESEPVTKELWFDIYVDNELTANAKDWQSSIRVAPGGSATMEVEATCAVGEPVYQWYDADNLAMEGETGASLTVTNVTGPAEYHCVVTDAYHTDEINVYFDVAVNVSLSADAVGERYRNVYHGETTLLEVTVDIAEGYAYHCQWYYNGEVMDHETGTSVTVPAPSESSADVVCEVSDDYGNEVTVSFYLTLTNDFYAWAMDGRNTVRVIAWQPATLTVEAGCHEGPITYRWQVKTDEYNEETWDYYHNIEDAENSPEYVTPAVTAAAEYRCVVSDPYETLNVDFTVLPVTVKPIVLNTETTAEIGEDKSEAYFSFTPETTGFYRFYSTGENDTYGSVYDAQWNLLASNDDGGDDYNFLIETTLEADQTYYLTASYVSDGDGSFSVWLKFHDENGFSAVAAEDEGYITVKAGNAAVLTVDANANQGELHYQWYNGSTDEPLEGETDAALSVEPVKYEEYYYCVVRDDYDNEGTVWFTVKVDNEFDAIAVGSSTVKVPYGQTADLAVSATALVPGFTYQWCDIGFNEIEGETSASFTTPAVTEYTRYHCRVTDVYDAVTHVTFVVGVDNNFSVTPVGDTDVSVLYGEDVTLQVTVTAANDEGLSIVWRDKNGDEIPGETGTTLTLPGVTAYGHYTCEVSDIYGNYDEVSFYVNVDSGFSARAKDDEEDIRVPYGAPAELVVEASAYEGVTITYEWYDTNGNIMEDVTGNTYTVPSVTGYEEYYCEVSDSSGAWTYVNFRVSVDTGLKAGAKDGVNRFSVPYGETLTLVVEASAYEGVALTYEWKREYPAQNAYGSWESETFPEATGGELVTVPATGYSEYTCIVSDPYGFSECVTFYVSVDTGLSVRAKDGRESFTVAPGETVTLAVEASAYEGVTLTYEWERIDLVSVDGLYSHWTSVRLPGETGDTLTVSSVSTAVDYRCTVSDGCGNEDDVTFCIEVKNGLQAEAEKTMFLVAPGGSVTFRVTASCTNGPVTYAWFNGNNVQISGDAAERTVTVTESGSWFCVVRDSYGNYTQLRFNVICTEPVPLVLRGDNKAVIENEYDIVLFSFTPEETGDYVIWSESEEDTFVTLYAEDLEELDRNDDGGENMNFRLSHKLTAGSTYYYAVHYLHDDTGVIPVRFLLRKDNGFSANPENNRSTVYVPYGHPATLTVIATADDGALYYAWKDSHGDAIAATAPGVLITGPITEYSYFECTVSDDYGNMRTVCFYVYVDNHFTVEAATPTSMYVMPGGSAAMAVRAEAAEGPFTYSWYRSYGDILIPGAEGPSYTAENVTASDIYVCVVKDPFGAEESVYFYVYLDNGFHVQPKDGVSQIFVNRGERASLEIEVSFIKGDVECRWYMYETYTDESGNERFRETLLEGETGRKLVTAPIERYTEYYCAVTDETGDTRTVYFYVNVTGGLSTQMMEDFRRVIVPYGESVTLASEQSADVPLTYRWFHITRDANGMNSRVEMAADTASITVGPVTAADSYERYATDPYGVTAYTYFFVTVDTGLAGGYGDELYFICPGGTVELITDVTPNPGFTFTYTWYSETEKLAETGASLVLENVTLSGNYYCTVEDGLGSYIEYYFTVIVTEAPVYLWEYNYETCTAGYCPPGGTPTVETVESSVSGTQSACAVQGELVYTTEFENPAFETQTKTVNKSALGHLWSEWADLTAPTCAAPGVLGRSCARCGAEETRDTPATGHAWGEPTYEWAADYSTVTAKRVCANDASHVETETVGATKETFSSGCSDGRVVYTSAAFTNPAFTVQVKEVLLGTESHDWGDPTYEWAEDYSSVTAKRVCRRDASHVETETAAASFTETTPAACTAQGEGKYVSAAFANPAFTVQTHVVSIPALGHSFTAKTAEDRYLKSAATCTAAAVYYKSCARCGAASETDTFESGAALGHKWSDWAETKAPTCTEAGEETRTCSRCTETETRTVEALGHDFSAEAVADQYLKSAATCTEPAVYYKNCTRCHAASETATFISGEALGHNWGDWAETKAPTCTEAGEEARTCSRCTEKETRPVEALGHDFSAWTQSKTPTCTEAGEETRSCSRCTEKETRPVEALGHDFSAWTQTKAPTCTEAGEETRSCSRCTEKETRAVEALGHDFSAEAVADQYLKSAATCTEPAVYYKNCTRCHAASETATFISGEALGHNWGDWAETKAPTCTEAGEEARTCSRCTEKETRALTALGHDWGAWTKLNDDVHQRVCGRDASHTETAAHTWNAGEVVKPATVTEPGVKRFTCTACGAEKTEEIGKLPDTPVTVTDPGSGISVTYDSKAYSQKITVRVVAVDTPESGLPAAYEKTYAVDISTYIGDKEVEPNAPVTVTIPVPQGFNAKTLKLFHVKDDGSVEEIACTVKDGKITFTALAFSVYVLADTSTEITGPAFMPGDVDGSGKVETTDARLALRCSIGLEKYPEGSREFLACDVNRDAKVGTDDARFILRHSIGLTDKNIVW